jgi:hypothetical protein
VRKRTVERDCSCVYLRNMIYVCKLFCQTYNALVPEFVYRLCCLFPFKAMPLTRKSWNDLEESSELDDMILLSVLIDNIC